MHHTTRHAYFTCVGDCGETKWCIYLGPTIRFERASRWAPTGGWVWAKCHSITTWDKVPRALQRGLTSSTDSLARAIIAGDHCFTALNWARHGWSLSIHLRIFFIRWHYLCCHNNHGTEFSYRHTLPFLTLIHAWVSFIFCCVILVCCYTCTFTFCS